MYKQFCNNNHLGYINLNVSGVCVKFFTSNRLHWNWQVIHLSFTIRNTIEPIGQFGQLANQELNTHVINKTPEFNFCFFATTFLLRQIFHRDLHIKEVISQIGDIIPTNCHVMMQVLQTFQSPFMAPLQTGTTARNTSENLHTSLQMGKCGENLIAWGRMGTRNQSTLAPYCQLLTAVNTAPYCTYYLLTQETIFNYPLQHESFNLLRSYSFPRIFENFGKQVLQYLFCTFHKFLNTMKKKQKETIYQQSVQSIEKIELFLSHFQSKKI